jgi:hypothetical protein
MEGLKTTAANMGSAGSVRGVRLQWVNLAFSPRDLSKATKLYYDE